MEERHPYLNITDPSALHAAVEAGRTAKPSILEASSRESIDRATNASALAHRYAPRNQHLIERNVDRWITKHINELTSRTILQKLDGTYALGGEAYIVKATLQHMKDEYRGQRGSALNWRTWYFAYSLREDGGPVQGSHDGLCDKCWVDVAVVLGGKPEARRVHPVHIAHFNYVSEFHLCERCLLDVDTRCAELGLPSVVLAEAKVA